MKSLIILILSFSFCMNGVAQHPKSNTGEKRSTSQNVKAGRASTTKSVSRDVDLSVISSNGVGDIYLGGFVTQFEGSQEKSRGEGLFVSISGGTPNLVRLSFLSDVREIFFTDRSNGWVSGYGGTYKTTDGGSSWQKLSFLMDVQGPIFFLDANTGWYFAQDESLKRVYQGKITVLKTFDNFPYIKKLQFTSPESGWLYSVVSGQSSFQTTNDGGKSWQKVRGYDGTITDFQSLNNFDAYLLTSTGLYDTNDGGRTWKLLRKTEADEGFDRLFFLDKQVGWLIGNESCATTTSGISWECSGLPGELQAASIRGFVFTDPRNGWLLTDQGLYISDDGGIQWSRKIIAVKGIRF